MKKIVLSIIFSILLINAFAVHISGGEMSYTYLGPGTNPGTLKYQVTLKMYKDCNAGGAALDDNVSFTVFNTQTNQQIRNITGINGTAIQTIQKIPSNDCVPDAIELVVCFLYRTYTATIDNLPSIPNGYTVSYQRCCRVNNMQNIASSSVGSTYFTKIPGTIDGAETNTSPVFGTKDTALICSNKQFDFDFSATDADGDRLEYTFYTAFSGGTTGNVNPSPASNPPYSPVNYINGYSSAFPLGAAVKIDRNTGLINGVAPNVGVSGNLIFAVTVLVTERRSGVVIGEHFKDLQVRVVDCAIPTVSLSPNLITCDGFNIDFSNGVVNNPVPTFFWDFGDPTSGILNTSTLETPNHQYSDTGIYKLKLVLNRGLQCGDSTVVDVKVYPGFIAGFRNSLPLCVGIPVNFVDTTVSIYGNTNYWRWDFGDPTTLADTARQRNPPYTFNAAGSYQVELIAASDKGCSDTIVKTIVVLDKPTISVFPKDTIYCGLDSIQVTAIGTGIFSWSPTTNIVGANTSTPLLFPPVTTKYIVNLDQAGCTNTDSVTVRPKFDLSNKITVNNGTICEGESVVLTGTSNYTTNITWLWSPAATTQSPTSSITTALPITNTTYSLLTTWGKNCTATANQPIIVKPLAIPNAGLDAFLCVGQPGGVQLSASGGDNYVWTPSTGLSNANISNPIAKPSTTTSYIVSVGVIGCTERRSDTVVVEVKNSPTFTLTNDTLICSIDTLQLNTNGIGSFSWSPNYNINNITSPNPLVSPDVPTKYIVKLTDAFGCSSTDSVFVNVKQFVSINAGADTTICKGDAFPLNLTSDAIGYKWTPATGLNSDIVKNPTASPLVTTLYQVSGNIGKCETQADILVTVAPVPIPDAGKDTTLCLGASVTLTATGGNKYDWTPATFLSSTTIPNPTVNNLTATTTYIVTVIDNIGGCPRPVKDTVVVALDPPVKADAGPADTSLVLGQTLQLNATGGVNYVWSPNTYLNNPLIADPVSDPLLGIKYFLNVTTAAGCQGNDTINVKVYKVDPDLYIPTAFSPNGDGLNDVLKPIVLGMKELKYFRVYNRWGILLFSTSQIGRGWDGTYKGKGQDPGAYVWMVEGTTFKNEKKFKKGSVILIK
jgi:gliding motility-associated-like protein